MSTAADFLLRFLLEADASSLVSTFDQAVSAMQSTGAEVGAVMDALNRTVGSKVVEYQRGLQRQLDQLTTERERKALEAEARIAQKVKQIRNRKVNIRKDGELSGLIRQGENFNFSKNFDRDIIAERFTRLANREAGIPTLDRQIKGLTEELKRTASAASEVEGVFQQLGAKSVQFLAGDTRQNLQLVNSYRKLGKEAASGFVQEVQGEVATRLATVKSLGFNLTNVRDRLALYREHSQLSNAAQSDAGLSKKQQQRLNALEKIGVRSGTQEAEADIRRLEALQDLYRTGLQAESIGLTQSQQLLQFSRVGQKQAEDSERRRKESARAAANDAKTTGQGLSLQAAKLKDIATLESIIKNSETARQDGKARLLALDQTETRYVKEIAEAYAQGNVSLAQQKENALAATQAEQKRLGYQLEAGKLTAENAKIALKERLDAERAAEKDRERLRREQALRGATGPALLQQQSISSQSDAQIASALKSERAARLQTERELAEATDRRKKALADVYRAERSGDETAITNAKERLSNEDRLIEGLNSQLRAQQINVRALQDENAERTKAARLVESNKKKTDRTNKEKAETQRINDVVSNFGSTAVQPLNIPAFYDPNGKGIQELKRDRREVRKAMLDIQTELERGRKAINEAGSKAPQVAGIKQMVDTLEQQRNEVRKRMLEINNAIEKVGTSEQAGDSGGRGFLSSLLDFAKYVLIYQGIQRITGGVRELGKEIIEVSAEFQRLGTSFVSILAAPALEKDKGFKLDTEQVRLFQAESQALFKDVQARAIETVATTEQYVQALQAALAVGQKIGLTQEQVLDITHRMVLAAGAFGIEFDKVGPSIAQILSGSARATNQLARNLGLVTKSQREQLKDSIKQGTVYEFLRARTEAFAQTAKTVENNFLNVSAALKDIFQVGGSEAIKPFFEFLNSEFVKIRDTFFGNSGTNLFTPALKSIIKGVQDFIGEILPDINRLFREVARLFNDSGEAIGGNTNLVKLFIRTLTGLVSLLRQFIGGQGIGGFIKYLAIAYIGFRLFTTILRSGGGLLRELALGLVATGVRFQAIEGQAIGAAAAVERVSVAATGASRALAFLGKATLWIAALTTVWQLISSVASASSDATQNIEDALEKLDKQLDKLRDNKEKDAKNADLFGLLDTFKQLSQIPIGERSKDDILRLAEVTGELEKRLGNAADSILHLGRTTAAELDVLRQKQHESAEQLRKDAEALEKLAQGPKGIAEITSLLDYRDNRIAVANDPTVGANGRARAAASAAEATKQLEEQAAAYLRLAKAAVGWSEEETFAALRTEEGRRKLLSVGRELADQIRESATQTDLEAQSSSRLIAAYGRQAGIIADLQAETQNLTATDKKRIQNERDIIAEETLRNKIRGAIILSLRQEAAAQGITVQQAITARQREIAENLKLLDSQKEVLNAKQDEVNVELALARASRDKETDPLRQAAIGERIRDLLAANRRIDSAREGQLSPDRKRQLQAEAKAEQDFLRQLSRSLTPGKPEGEDEKKKHKRQRDELSDFTRELDRQLGILNRLNNSIRGEVDRTVELRLKAIQELSQSGAITAEAGLALERALLEDQQSLADKLRAVQQDYLNLLTDPALKLAGKQQGKDDAKDETDTDNRDRIFDTRLKLAQDKLELLKSSVDEFRKHEERLTDAVKRLVERRIQVREKELDFLDEYAKRGIESLAKVAELQGELGFISSSAAFNARQRAGVQQRQVDRDKIIRDLFPILDPQIQQELGRAADAFLAATAGSNPDSPIGRVREQLQQVNEEFLKNPLGAGNFDAAQGFRNALSGNGGLLVKLLLGDGRVAEKFAPLVQQYEQLKEQLVGISKDIAGGKKPEDTAREKVQTQIESLEKQVFTDFGVRLSDQYIVAYNTLLGYAKRTAAVSESDAIEAIKKLSDLRLGDLEAENELIQFQHRLYQEQLGVQRSIAQFDQQRIDAMTELVNRQKELGILSESEAGVQLDKLNAAKLISLEQERDIARRRLATETANLKGDPESNPAVAERQLEAAQAVNELTLKISDLKLQAHDAASRLRATSDALRQIGSAIAQLPDPASNLPQDENRGIAGITKLAPAFEALANILDRIDNTKRKTVFEEAQSILLSGAQAFGQAGAEIPARFREVINDFRTGVREATGIASKALQSSSDYLFRRIIEAADKFVEKTTGRKSNDLLRDDDGSLGTQLLIDANRKRRAELIAERDTGSGVVGFNRNGKLDAEIVKLDKEYDALQAKLAALKDALSPEEAASVLDELLQQQHDYLGQWDDIAEWLAGNGPGNEIKETKLKITDAIRGFGQAISSILSGISQGGAGGIIGGISGLFKTGSFAAKAVPLIGEAISVVGGVISFFGARARQKTHEMAETITKGITELRDQISSNAIGLGEGIREVEQRLISARAQLSGRKGGKEELAKIEEDTQAALKQLREQAKHIQDDFRAELDLLRQPAELRDLAGQIKSIVDKTKEFVDSFENVGEMEDAAKDAFEFIERSIGELKGQIQKSLDDLQTQLQQTGEEFRRQEKDILNQGFVSPVVSEVEQKRRQLVDLERDYRNKRKEIEDQISAEQKKLDYVNQRADVEKIISDLMHGAAGDLSQAARDLADAAQAWESAKQSPFVGGNQGYDQLVNALSAQSNNRASQSMNVSVDVKVNGRDARPGEVTVGVRQADHLRIAGRVARPSKIPK